MKKTILTAFGFFVTLLLTAGNPGKIKTSQASNGITFTENKGQVSDQDFKPRPDILFGGSADGLVYHLRNNGISYQLSRVDSRKESEGPKRQLKKQLVDQLTIYRLDINWQNCNSNSRVETADALEESSNYYLAGCPDGRRNIKSYKSVTYKNIYNSIDLHYYEKAGALKYDYIVAPGADYKQIKLQVNGADNIEMDQDGGIVLKTPLGNIKEEAPLVYQQGRQLSARWKLKENVLSFEIDAYQPQYALIIDPVIRFWGTYYGGPGDEYMNALATNTLGDVYAVGWTISSTGTAIATSGAFQTTAGGMYDSYIVKFNSAGVRQWSTFYGGSGTDEIHSCDVDASGNLYIAGNSDSPALSTTGAYQSSNAGGRDCFLAKFDASGTRIWATYYGDYNNEYGGLCKTDAAGNVYVGGDTYSSAAATLATAGAYQATSQNYSDGFLAKFNSSGIRQWGTYYGGAGYEGVGNVYTDAGNNVYMIGSCESNTGSWIASSGAYQASYGGGGGDGFVAKFNSAGVRQWGTFYGGSDNEGILGIAGDASGNIFISGYTLSNTGTAIATTGAHQAAYGGGTSDAFLAKFNSSGVNQWGTYYGGTGSEAGESCATDAAGNVYISGYTSSPSGTTIASAGSYQSSYGGSPYDAYFVKFDGAGVRQWGSYYGGAGDERANDCIIDASGNIYLCGVTYTNNGTMGSSGSHQPAYAGGSSDGFLAKFFDCTVPSNPVSSTPTTNQTVCSTSSATLSASGSGTISWYSASSGGTALGAGAVFVTPTLSAGTSTFYAEAYTCLNSASRTAVTVTVNARPLIAINSGSICSGNSYTLTPSGANTYTITGGSTVVSPGSTTSYSVTGTSNLGCPGINTAISTITVNITPTISANNGTLCTGKSFTILPAGADTYTYSGGSAVVSPTAGTTYTVQGSSFAGCPASNMATSSVTVYTTPTVTANSGTICAGAPFTITPSGANFYSVTGGTLVVSPPTSTNYVVTGLTSQGCTNTAVSTITVFAGPTISAASGTICLGQTFTIVPSGASTYSYSSGSPMVSPAATTVYSVSGQSTAGCVSASAGTLAVTVNSVPVISVNSGTICTGASFTIVPSGASTYTYSGGSAVVSPVSTSGYSVSGTSPAGCVSTLAAVANVTVLSATLPTITINSGSICTGSSFTLLPGNAGPGATYTIIASTGTVGTVITPTALSHYSVIATSSAGCASSNTVISTVTVNTTPTIAINSASICSGALAVISPSGAASYSITGNSFTVSPSATSFYSVTGTSTAGCVSGNTAVATVSVFATPTISVNSPTICSGFSAAITPGGATSYSITGNSFTVSPAATSFYSVTGTSTAGCVSGNTAVATVSVFVTPTISVNNPTLCAGASAVIIPNGAGTYSINGGTFTVNPSTSTSYSITGTSIAGCASSNTAISTVTVLNRPNVALSASQLTLCAGESTTLIATGAIQYTWDAGSHSNTLVVTPSVSISYSLLGVGSNGCSSSAGVSLVVSPCTNISTTQFNQAGIMLFPNPSNGTFVVKTEEQGLLIIYNALGQLMLVHDLKAGENRISLSESSMGIYFAEVKTSNGTKMIKFVVE